MSLFRTVYPVYSEMYLDHWAWGATRGLDAFVKYSVEAAPGHYLLSNEPIEEEDAAVLMEQLGTIHTNPSGWETNGTARQKDHT